MKPLAQDPRRRRRGRLLAPPPALADVTIGVSLSLTGPASGLGIPMQQPVQAVADRRSPARSST